MTGSKLRLPLTFRGEAQRESCMTWHCATVGQSLHVNRTVLERLREHRQIRKRDSEAGGQLFGTVTSDSVSIVRATGPYATDQRSRYQYRSNPIEAQRTINALAIEGLLFLGEWHTHAEATPDASAADIKTMALINEHSQTNVSALFLLIVGCAPLPNGIAVYSTSGSNLKRWGASE
jgi:integrative and conjugative element protein (TIGR02256 family)